MTMKKYIIPTLALAGFLAYNFSKDESDHKNIAANHDLLATDEGASAAKRGDAAPQQVAAKPLVPQENYSPKANLKRTPKSSERADSAVLDDIAGYEEYLDDLSTKALPSEEDVAKLGRMVNSPEFQNLVFDKMTAKGVQEFSFSEEKLRFKHQTYLYEMYVYGNESTRRQLRSRLEYHIFSSSFLAIKDVKLRQSLAGDKIDYLKFLKNRFPDAFEKVEARIQQSDSALLKYCLAKV